VAASVNEVGASFVCRTNRREGRNINELSEERKRRKKG